ncbi:MAG: hypothetical protein OXB92_03345 [Acidimicrobiaceae bacterium]|nr:hypothetical protein [Acidimicrobiaceae bacterium]
MSDRCGGVPAVVGTVKSMADDRPLEEQIRLEYRGKVAWVTIDRPEDWNRANIVDKFYLVE